MAKPSVRPSVRLSVCLSDYVTIVACAEMTLATAVINGLFESLFLLVSEKVISLVIMGLIESP
jgi:hypothetical protein